jgi:hypothetical protein
VSANEELLGKNSSGIHYTQKLAITSPTSDGRSVGIVRSRNKATKLLFIVVVIINSM